VVGVLAGTISQVAFALAYRAFAHRGPTPALLTGFVGFTASTAALSYLRWPVLPTFGLVLVALAGAYLLTRRSTQRQPVASAKPPRWDIPVRMIVATAETLAITAAAPVIGPALAGRLSPLPVFGIVLAVFSQ